MQAARVTTIWVGTGTDTDPFRPLVGDVFAPVGWVDIVGHTPIPTINAYTIRVTADTAVIDAIDTDPRFIVWDVEEVEDGAP